MKKLICLASAAIVATMLFSCNKLENNTSLSDESTIKVELTATADAPDTKVTIGSKTSNKFPVTWNAEGETVTMYEVTSEGNKTYHSAEEYTLGSGNKTAKFTFEVTAKKADSYDYYFFSPGAVVNSLNSGKFNVKLPAVQKSGAASVDPASIILQATALAQPSQTATFNANFKMISAVGKMTLKNLPLAAGESVKSVSIQAKGKDFAATAYLGTDGTFSHHDASVDKITVDVSELTTTGDFDVWFNCWPCALVAGDKLIITANTEGAVYTREISLTAAREFKAGAVNEIPVDMTNAEKPEIVEFKLKALNNIQASDVVVITMKVDGAYYAMSNDKGTNAAPAAVLVEVTDNAISNPDDNLKWNISSSNGAYVIHPDGDASKVLYTLDDNNRVRVGTQDGASWVLDASLDNKYLKYNTASFDRNLGVYNKSDWRAYKKADGAAHANIAGQEVCFFAFSDSRTPQNLSFPQAAYNAEVGGSFTAPVLSGAHTTVTYTSSNTAVATVNESTGAVTLVAAGTTTITATAEANATYKAGTASYTLTVTSATALQTMDEIFAAATTAGSTATAVKVKFNNWVISGVKNNNAYATDGTKGFIIYQSGHGFEAGDKLSGTVTCKVQLYKGAAELTSITSESEGLTVTKGGTLTAKTATIAELSGVNTGAYFNLGTLTFDGTYFTDGTNKIKPFGSVIELPTLTSGNSYNVKGMFIQYDSTKEIAPLYATDFEEAGAPDPTCATPVITIDGSGKATITCETSGATIKYAISDTEPASFANTYSTPVQLTDGQTIWAKASATGMQDSKVASKKYTAGEAKTLIIDGSQLTKDATKAEADYTYDGFTITMSDGAKVQSSTGDNKFTDSAILIGKSGAYIYNKTLIPGKITKFEIYSNKGASAKVSVGVLFSKTAISEYAEGTNTYTETLSTLDNVYDCSSKIPDGAKYFWYQVTNSNNSQVQFRITYTE